jgi:hypothetical protein
MLTRVTACTALILGLLFSVPTVAVDAIVKHKANLRSDPSTAHAPIATLKPRDDVELLEPTEKSGYYHVRTADNEEGWIYGRSVEIVRTPAAGTTPATTPAPAAGGTTSPPGTTVETVIGTAWDKPAPVTGSFNGLDGVCQASGDGGDSATNIRKNRTDDATAPHLVTWKALAQLSYPVAARSLADWTPDQINKIQPYGGIEVSVVGYLTAIKVEDTGSGESTNCHFTNPTEVDWHMPLVEHAGDPETTAIVVETTPRVRAHHPKWTPAALSPWVASGAPVRITGWVLLDPEHRAHLGKYRSTLWEVHPITRIEVFHGGQWVNADDLP